VNVLGLVLLAITIILLAIQQVQDVKWYCIERDLYTAIARKDNDNGKHYRTN